MLPRLKELARDPDRSSGIAAAGLDEHDEAGLVERCAALAPPRHRVDLADRTQRVTPLPSHTRRPRHEFLAHPVPDRSSRRVWLAGCASDLDEVVDRRPELLRDVCHAWDDTPAVANAQVRLRPFRNPESPGTVAERPALAPAATQGREFSRWIS